VVKFEDFCVAVTKKFSHYIGARYREIRLYGLFQRNFDIDFTGGNFSTGFFQMNF
jgi:hypothetical protein